ncbi:hypothetical protein NDA00_25815 [Funiculus sociatus GB2-M2]|uniref:hypothetical protein n=1 Tax=Funiculus sociatus TaxID=450527 RepID=UPI003297B276
MAHVKRVRNPPLFLQQFAQVQVRRVQRFKSPEQAQRFLSAFEPIRGHFHPKQHELSAKRYREQVHQRFENWQEITCLKVVA